jgi:class I fructose-bisphosphate aldolase
MAMTRVKRPTLNDLELSLGKRTRLQRLMYKYGPANGTLLFLPIDQGLEHGPRDFFVNPPAKDPQFQLRIAKEGNFSGIVYQIGIAEKYMYRYAGDVPLVLKLNGKTEIPSDKAPISPVLASVEDAVRLGADAVGYTLYVGSPRQDEDFEQFRKVRADADRYGMPVIVWAYPRGEAIDAKGGRDSLYAVDYAARVASEVGADIVKLNVPKINPEKDQASPKPYNTLRLSREEATRMVVESAGRALVLFSGGEMEGDEDLITKARIAMDAGATGLIFGRNLWQRSHDEALAMSRQLHDMMKDYGA